MRLIQAARRVSAAILVAACPSLSRAATEPAVSTLAGAAASAEVGVRAGDHAGFGRIVFDLPPGATVQSVAADSRILLVFSGVSRIGQSGALPRNLSALQVQGTTATLTLAPGTNGRRQRIGNRLVIDLLDPPEKPAKSPVSRPAGARPPLDNVGPSRVPQDAHDLSAAQDEAVVTPPPAPAAHPPQTAALDEVKATDLPPPGGTLPVTAPLPTPEPPRTRPVARLAADATVGAAAFRRDRWGLVVLDRRLSIPVPPELPGASLSQGPVSTVLQVPLDPAESLSLDHVPGGWSVSIVTDAPPGSLVPQPAGDAVVFAVQKIGRSVTILDPATGGALLVGTSLAAGQDAAVGAGRRTPLFAVVPTWLGVAIEPFSDAADLHAGAAAFVLRGGGLQPGRPETDGAVSRLDLPDETVGALLNRLRAQLASAAAAPPRARSQARLAAAQAELALGLGVEAQALIQRAIADDPEAAADPRIAATGDIAALLAGRPEETVALDKPELADDPEMDLWRGLRDRRLGRDTDSARRLPAHLALARSYPEPLRRLIWPDLVEAAAENGVTASQLTPYAAALALEHAGKIDQAIVAWQTVAAGPDRRDQVRATTRGTELQLASGRIGPDEAADILERQSYAWRGDGQELALRLRAAELRAAAGRWREALQLLRTTDELFPDQKQAILARKTGVFEAMISADGGTLSALDVVMLASDYADCVPDNAKNTGLAHLLAEKLVALDLPARAIPVLQGLVERTTTGPARAEFGLRLGQLLLESSDSAGAETALQASEATELPGALLMSRRLLMARIRAAQGRAKEAAASLATLDTAEADNLRASLLGEAGDWKGSLEALDALAQKTLPAQGALAEADQALVIREATAAVQAGDAGKIVQLERLLPRMSGASAEMLRMLTEPAITSTRELPRAATELKLNRAIPAQIQKLAFH